VGDVGVLPVEGDRVGRVRPVPVAELAGSGRHRELLVEGAVSERLRWAEVARQGRIRAAVGVGARDDRWVNGAVDDPRREAARLEARVDEHIAVTYRRRWWRRRGGRGRWRRRRG